MNFRKLIEQAMFELRDEFAVLVAKKLEQLLGDQPSAARPGAKSRTPRAVGRPSRPKEVAKSAPKGGGRRPRAPSAHMDDLRGRVLSALADGAPRKRAQILAGARLAGDEGTRVAALLRKLKDEGVVSMQGNKASATYTLVPGKGGAGQAPDPTGR